MKKCDLDKIINFIKNLYKKDFVALHEPVFIGNEKKYVIECIDSAYVSSVGKYVDMVEKQFADYVGAKFAVAVVNGTAALHTALKIIGVKENDEVITQPLTFVATVNAISYCGAKPVFVDVDLDTLGLSPTSLKEFLENNAIVKNNKCINKKTGRVIKACVPMHTFGHPCKIDDIKDICHHWKIELIEDAAESLGSYYKNKFTGTFGRLGIFSFNGNKIITSGGGGMIVTDDEELAKKAKHITTTAKIPHPYEYIHDEIGYNYRMPNLNAALLLAQMENLDKFIENKRELAEKYEELFKAIGIKFVKEPPGAKSNYWLNAIILNSKDERDKFLEETNKNKIQTRPAWRLMYKLPMYKDCYKTETPNAEYIEERLVNLPSGVRK